MTIRFTVTKTPGDADTWPHILHFEDDANPGHKPPGDKAANHAWDLIEDLTAGLPVRAYIIAIHPSPWAEP